MSGSRNDQQEDGQNRRIGTRPVLRHPPLWSTRIPEASVHKGRSDEITGDRVDPEGSDRFSSSPISGVTKVEGTVVTFLFVLFVEKVLSFSRLGRLLVQ